jgi:hypothetical protein
MHYTQETACYLIATHTTHVQAVFSVCLTRKKRKLVILSSFVPSLDGAGWATAKPFLMLDSGSTKPGRHGVPLAATNMTDQHPCPPRCGEWTALTASSALFEALGFTMPVHSCPSSITTPGKTACSPPWQPRNDDPNHYLRSAYRNRYNLLVVVPVVICIPRQLAVINMYRLCTVTHGRGLVAAVTARHSATWWL